MPLCPDGQECTNLCRFGKPACWREALRERGYKLVDGVVEEITAEERAERDKANNPHNCRGFGCW